MRSVSVPVILIFLLVILGPPLLVVTGPAFNARHSLYTPSYTGADSRNVTSQPVLEDLTSVPDAVPPGTEITFSMNYTDPGNATPDYVRLFIDGAWNGSISTFEDDLLNVTMNPLDVHDKNCTDGKEYTWTWTPGSEELGVHSYSFLAMTGYNASKLVPVNNSFEVMDPPVPNSTVFGRVFTGTETPVPGATVVICGGETGCCAPTIGTYHNTTTDTEGNYSRSLRLGSYFLYVNATGYHDSAAYDFILPGAGYEVEKDFVLLSLDAAEAHRTTSMGGYIRGGNGTGIADAVVTVVTGSGDNESAILYDNLTDRTDRYGHYFIEGISIGTWVVTVEAEGYLIGWLRLTFGTEPLDRNLTMLPEMIFYNVTGAVEPASAKIKLGYIEVDVNRTTGRFCFNKLVPDNYTLEFSAEGCENHRINLSLIDGDVDIGTVVLERSPVILVIGPLLDDDGEPVVGVLVSFIYDGNLYSASTDAEGTAAFPGLALEIPPRGVEITASKDGNEVTWSTGGGIPAFTPGNGDGDDTIPGFSPGVVAGAFLSVLLVLFALSTSGRK